MPGPERRVVASQLALGQRGQHHHRHCQGTKPAAVDVLAHTVAGAFHTAAAYKTAAPVVHVHTAVPAGHIVVAAVGAH